VLPVLEDFVVFNTADIINTKEQVLHSSPYFGYGNAKGEYLDIVKLSTENFP
jgi:hypothetical protein